jgi:hypothetical protein
MSNGGRRLGLALACLAFLGRPHPVSGQAVPPLSNEYLRAEFAGPGLSALVDARHGFKVQYADEGFSVKIDGERIGGRGLRPATVESAEPGKRTFGYDFPRFQVKVVYELRSGWRFVSKQIFVDPVRRAGYHVDEIEAFSSGLAPAIREALPLTGGKFGMLFRFARPQAASRRPAFGAFLLYQNPFNSWVYSGQRVSASYVADIDWKPDYGPFASDRFCIGLQRLSGARFPAEAVPEWRYIADYTGHLAENPVIDMAEADALVECVRAFLLHRPEKSVRVHVPWCENDYQIDIAAPGGWDEYRRIIDRAAEMGCRHMLFTPANSGLSSLEENRDAWNWENILFFALGQKIRKGEWDPARDAVPAGLRARLDYGKRRNIGFVSYSYPSLPFDQDPKWTRWAGAKAGGYSGADTGLRSFQDWWIGKLVDFVKATGAAGFSFDHWWIAYANASSKYAQWYGCRRVLETLRARAMDIVIDGRQQYMNFGPWTWLAGSYPHPTLTDEQPESFTAFPDLHTDRVSANRQRFAAWVYRMQRFCPPEIMPGFMTHQTERSDSSNLMRRDRFRPRDWDVLGWRYSVLSSIATAPFNHVINYIPARDPDEHRAFSEEDRQWLRGWLDWTDSNAEILRRIKPIIGQPMLGRVDGTAACAGGRGFVFLFNPNYRQCDAEFTLDASIGLDSGTTLLLEELYPERGKLIGHPRNAFWRPGDVVRVTMGGTQAVVLRVRPAPDRAGGPLLFNVRGRTSLEGGKLELAEIEAEAGTYHRIAVLLPSDARVTSMTVNRRRVPFRQAGDSATAEIRFAGDPFTQCQPVWTYDPAFAGGAIKAAVKIPRRVFEQLRRRHEAWPVPYTEDDLLAPWLGSHRLLLYAQILEPDDGLVISMTVDGKPVAVRKGYNSIYGHSPERTFLGYYADVSFLEPDKVHALAVTLPALPAGRFQGLFFENVEPEYTRAVISR